MKILIVKYGALGDVVRTSYILRGIVEKYSNVSITWLTSKVAKDLLRFNHNIDNILTEDCNFKKVFDEEFDLVLSLDDELEILKKIEKIYWLIFLLIGIIIAINSTKIVEVYLKTNEIDSLNSAKKYINGELIQL